MSKTGMSGVVLATFAAVCGALLSFADDPKDAKASIQWASDLKRAAAEARKSKHIVMVWITIGRQEWKLAEKFDQAWRFPGENGDWRTVSSSGLPDKYPNVRQTEIHGSVKKGEIWYEAIWSDKKRGGPIWHVCHAKDASIGIQVGKCTFGVTTDFVVAYDPKVGWVTNADRSIDPKAFPCTYQDKKGWVWEPEASVWEAPSVVDAVTEDAVALRLGLAEAATIAKEYDITTIPTLLFIGDDGHLLGRQDGLLPKPETVTEAIAKAKDARAGAGKDK